MPGENGKENVPVEKPFIVCIAGGSASGKTTFTAQLEEAFAGRQLLTIHMDRYFKPKEIRPHAQGPVTGVEYLDDNHPDSFDLPGLHRDLDAAIESGAYQVVLIEGLLTLWDPALSSRADLKLFIDCRPDERIVRRLRRNMGYGLSFEEIAHVYLDLVRYRHDEFVEPSKWRADLILNGSNPSPAALEMVLRRIEEKAGLPS